MNANDGSSKGLGNAVDVFLKASVSIVISDSQISNVARSSPYHAAIDEQPTLIFVLLGLA